MNFLFDNNISPKIAHAARELFQNNKHKIIHLTDKFTANTQDEVWLRQLIKEGNWALISIDRFQKNAFEKAALDDPNLISFILNNSWSKLRFIDQSYRLIRWIPQIISTAESNSCGVFAIPINYGSGKPERIEIKHKKHK